MKKSYAKPKTNISKIPYSKTSINKNSLKLSKNYNLKIKSDSIKDTLYGSVVESQNPDNIKNSRLINSKEYSFSKNDNKFNIFSYSLKNSKNQRNNSSNFSNTKNFAKTQEENSENISSSEEIDLKSLDKNNLYEQDDDTNKIDYRYYPKIPEIESSLDKNKSLFWLATYDKLMKKSKIKNNSNSRI